MGVPEQLLVGDVLRYAALRTPRAPAASLGDRQITFEAAALKAERLAASLYKVGVRHGDRVAWWAETSLEAMPLYFALAQLGAVFVPLNPRYTEDECRQVLNKADPRLVLTDDGRGGHAKLSDLTDAGKAPPVNVAETDPFILFFTSGTT